MKLAREVLQDGSQAERQQASALLDPVPTDIEKVVALYYEVLEIQKNSYGNHCDKHTKHFWTSSAKSLIGLAKGVQP